MVKMTTYMWDSWKIKNYPPDETVLIDYTKLRFQNRNITGNVLFSLERYDWNKNYEKLGREDILTNENSLLKLRRKH